MISPLAYVDASAKLGANGLLGLLMFIGGLAAARIVTDA